MTNLKIPCGPEQYAQVPLDMPVGQPSEVAGLVSYIVRPEARLLTGELFAYLDRTSAESHTRPMRKH